jgi:broad specificity phosphatase PhoE
MDRSRSGILNATCSMARRLLLASALVIASGSAVLAQAGRAMTVIVVRHAEKAAEPANDPGLTAAGVERAAALWSALKDAGVTAVITTQFARTVETAAPTAAKLGLTPEVVPTGGASHAAAVAAQVKRHPGATVLVVGHSNTVPAIVAALGAREPAPICDEEYDNLYVVSLAADGRATVVHSRFGAPTPAAGCKTMK